MNSGTPTIATMSVPPVSPLARKAALRRGTRNSARSTSGLEARACRQTKRAKDAIEPPNKASVTAISRSAIGSSVRATVRQTRPAPSSVAPGRSSGPFEDG